ncbi:MAG TPA: hypothetical protein VLY83_02115, partial [Methanoregula sp.]|nr:hypothetical protein [Methanoregula sp.]
PCFYFLYFITLNAAVPGYVLRVWNLGAIGGGPHPGRVARGTLFHLFLRVLLVKALRTFYAEGSAGEIYSGILIRNGNGIPQPEYRKQTRYEKFRVFLGIEGI